jgi:rhodanese-related sulfurtransferase
MFQNIDAAELESMREQRDITLIDVRTDAEVARGIIAGARHIPLFTLPQHTPTLADAATIVIYCQSGGRSAQACSYLAQQGFADLYNLSGGILAWLRDGKTLSDGPANS